MPRRAAGGRDVGCSRDLGEGVDVVRKGLEIAQSTKVRDDVALSLGAGRDHGKRGNEGQRGAAPFESRFRQGKAPSRSEWA